MPGFGWFLTGAMFRYLGPSFAVLLFPAVGILGVAWLRIATAAILLATVSRPWHVLRRASTGMRLCLLLLGACFASMNAAFYLALERLPLSLVAAIEFSGLLGLALYGSRSRRNVVSVALAGSGLIVLIDFEWSSDSVGLMWAAINSAMFVLYVVLGHRLASSGGAENSEYLGAAMLIALLIITPIGIQGGIVAIRDPVLLAAGIGVGISSSVIPYVCDRIAMSRMTRERYALLLGLLPAIATIIGFIVLRQIPGPADWLGIVLVMLAVMIHRPFQDRHQRSAGTLLER
jgi:inner membrane transporter RhtA